MNEITRKAANALVATVDFFQGALVAEAQAGEEKQRQLDALVSQLRDQTKDADGACGLLQEEIEDLQKHRDELKDRLASLEAERNDLLQKCKNLRAEKPLLSLEEIRRILVVLARVKALLGEGIRTKVFAQNMVCLAREMKALDGIKLEPL